MDVVPEFGSVTLSETLDPTAAKDLLAALRGRRNGPLTIDASAVTRVSTPALQVLLAAASSWQSDGKRFAIVSPSAPFAEVVALLGITPGQLSMETVPT